GMEPARIIGVEGQERKHENDCNPEGQDESRLLQAGAFTLVQLNVRSCQVLFPFEVATTLETRGLGFHEVCLIIKRMAACSTGTIPIITVLSGLHSGQDDTVFNGWHHTAL
ncbi:MAG TPA: hypothetical protein PLN94_18320, partial [Thiolinea sp.]|nr:hypothetical protein [Thiolinea sp.]